jgi:hypothetical protein
LPIATIPINKEKKKEKLETKAKGKESSHIIHSAEKPTPIKKKEKKKKGKESIKPPVVPIETTRAMRS